MKSSSLSWCSSESGDRERGSESRDSLECMRKVFDTMCSRVGHKNEFLNFVYPKSQLVPLDEKAM